MPRCAVTFSTGHTGKRYVRAVRKIKNNNNQLIAVLFMENSNLWNKDLDTSGGKKEELSTNLWKHPL